MNKSILVATAISLVGCGAGTGTIQFATDKKQYAVGDAAELRLKNGLSAAVNYNLCFSELINSSGDVIERPLEEVCYAHALRLKPGGTGTFKRQLPQVPPGEYKYVSAVWRDGEKISIETHPFAVQ